jgi:hypothetical protein
LQVCAAAGGQSIGAVRRDGISRCEPFVRPEKRRCALTLSGGRGGPGSSNIAAINDQQLGSSSVRRDLDQTAAKRLAPRRFSCT